MPLKFETRCNLCISLPVDCHKSQLLSVLPLLKPSATNWRSASTSPRVHNNWAPLRPTIANCLSFFFFLLSDPTLLSCGGRGARCWSLLAERKIKYVKEKIIVLKRGQGLGSKANFLSSSDQLVRAPCTGQRKTLLTVDLTPIASRVCTGWHASYFSLVCCAEVDAVWGYSRWNAHSFRVL